MDKEFLARGKRGLVYAADFEGKKVVIKERNPDAMGLSTIRNEFNFLKKLNEHGIGPQIMNYENDQLTMEHVEGQRILEYFETHSKKDIVSVLKDVFKQLRKMDDLGINKSEMTYPYKHIIIRDRKPVMIDFERCRMSEKPQNVTQFCQFLTSKEVRRLLEIKGVLINEEMLFDKARDYKDSYSDSDFKSILDEMR